ncbi:MAG: GNAT family N-acetyltransferase [Ilumatobacter sp.]|nr:GNAT family N-acetyltransferase [Ilumatobacter sp.]
MEPAPDAPAGTVDLAQPSADDLARWRSTVVLGDGTTAVIRPIEPDDRAALAAFHERQSSESKYRRFFSPKPTLRESDLDRFTEVDFVDRVALVVEDRGEFIAWASYERLKNRSDAEVAFMVDDEQHGKGIATLLLEHMAAIAKTNGIERFTAQTLADNRGMLAVFGKAGWPVQRRFDSGVIDVDFPLADTSEFVDSVERREHLADSRSVARLLLPTSIAVIGASDDVGSVGHSVWTNVASRSRCPVYAVNPAHDTVGGRQSFATVTEIPDEVGLAVITVPSAALAGTVQQCIDKRVRGAIVVTAVAEGDVDVTELIALGRRNGLRIIGPSSFGVASPRRDTLLQAALVDVSLPPGHVALSMQSGTLASSLLRRADRLRLPMSWFVSLGDKSDISANDLLQFWEDDDATTVIGLYTESLGNPRKFARIARRVSAVKPIVAVRTGAALFGAANAALYEQTGLIEVPTVSALLDTVRVFESQPLMDGRRVAVVSNAPSPAVLATATMQAAGLDVVDAPQLDWRSTADDYAEAVRATLADDDVDAVMVIHAPPDVGAIDAEAGTIDAAARGATKPVVAVMLGVDDGPIRPGSAVPNFMFPEQAAAALTRLAAYSDWRRLEADAAASDVDGEPVPGLDVGRARAVIARHLGEHSVPPQAIAELLASYGVTMAPTVLVDVDDAVEAAGRIGYPVAIKAFRRRIGRSVEAGIALDLGDTGDVVDSVTRMQAHLGPDAEKVYVQPMVPPGADLRIRTTIDPGAGPLITVGIGGVQASAIGDEESRLAPVSPSTARALVAATRAAALLDDAGLDVVADQVTRVAQLVSDHAEIAELDLNPVIVSGSRAAVVDAHLELRTPERAAPPAVRRLE